MTTAVQELKTREELTKARTITKGRLTKATKKWERAADMGENDKASEYGLKMEEIQVEMDAIEYELKMLDLTDENVLEAVKEHKAKTKSVKAKAKTKAKTKKVKEPEVEEVMKPKSESSITDIAEQIMLKADEEVIEKLRIEDSKPEPVIEEIDIDVSIKETNKPEVKKKGDWPQHSYRVEVERYPILKEHVKGETGSGLTPFKSLADMSRSLNDADFYGDLEFWLTRSNEQFGRFIRACEADSFDQLSETEQDMVRGQQYKFKAHTDIQKKQLVQKFKKLLMVIKQINFMEFVQEYEQRPHNQRITNFKAQRAQEAERDSE